MSDYEAELFTLLVPMVDMRMIVPRACVAEVTSFSEPTPVEGAVPWLLGHIEWSGAQVPLISFEGASGKTVPKPSSRTRIAIFNCLGNGIEARAFGVITQGFPQLIRVNESILKLKRACVWPDDGPTLCVTEIVNHQPIIPDLERLETMIGSALKA